MALSRRRARGSEASERHHEPWHGCHLAAPLSTLTSQNSPGRYATSGGNRVHSEVLTPSPPRQVFALTMSSCTLTPGLESCSPTDQLPEVVVGLSPAASG
jgi:hypothetical protein